MTRSTGNSAVQVQKSWDQFEIDETDALEGSELGYDGIEVSPMLLDATHTCSPYAS